MFGVISERGEQIRENVKRCDETIRNELLDDKLVKEHDERDNEIEDDMMKLMMM